MFCVCFCLLCFFQANFALKAKFWLFCALETNFLLYKLFGAKFWPCGALCGFRNQSLFLPFGAKFWPFRTLERNIFGLLERLKQILAFYALERFFLRFGANVCFLCRLLGPNSALRVSLCFSVPWKATFLCLLEPDFGFVAFGAKFWACSAFWNQTFAFLHLWNQILTFLGLGPIFGFLCLLELKFAFA